MDIKNINEIEYFYIFQIDNLKKAKTLCEDIIKTIKQDKISLESNFDKMIQTYNKDFISICNNLIERTNIVSIEDYNNAVKSLIIINAKTKQLINENKNKKYKAVLKSLYKKYLQIESNIPFATTRTDMFFNNHITATLIILVLFLVAEIIFFAIFSDNEILIAVSAATMIVILLLYFIFFKKIEKGFTIDRINRTIYKNTYVYSVNKELTKKDIETISKLINITK